MHFLPLDAGFVPEALVGLTLSNTTDSSACTITANTETTVTCTLAGGTDNDWDASDAYTIGTEPTTNSEVYLYENGVDLLGGGGVDKLDNDGQNIVFAKPDGSNAATPAINAPLTLRITHQAAATNDAIIFVRLIFYM